MSKPDNKFTNVTSHTIESLEQTVWLQLNKGEWPTVLAEIKPKKWDSADLNTKGRLVLDHLGQIIYKITLLTNRQHLENKAYLHIQPARKLPFNIGQHFTCRI
jgi:hypothetical protein